MLVYLITTVLVAAGSFGLTLLAGGNTNDLVTSMLASVIPAWLFVVPAVRGFDTYKRKGRAPDILGNKQRWVMGGLAIAFLIAIALLWPTIGELRRSNRERRERGSVTEPGPDLVTMYRRG